MQDNQVWLINICTNIGLGLILVGVLKWFLNRFIADLDKKLREMIERIGSAESEIEEIKENYVQRFEDVKEHFTSEIKTVNKDGNRDKLLYTRILTELKSKIDYLVDSIAEIRKKIFNN